MNQAIRHIIFNRMTAVTLVIALTAAVACSGATPSREESKTTKESKTTQDQRLPAQQSARIPQNDEHRRRCQFWALNNLRPTVHREFAKLKPNSMDDLDRILWRSKLHPNDHLGYYKNPDDSQDIPPLMPQNPGIYCRDYWAEPLNRSNADLRNHGFETQCRTQLEQHITNEYVRLGDQAGREEENELVYRIPNQYVRILQWLDLNGDDLMDSANPPYRILEEQSRHGYAHYGRNSITLKQKNLDHYQRETQTRLDLEWLGILGAAGMNSSSSSSGLRMCHNYYPQVFYGYWIPMDPEKNPDSDRKQEINLPRYEELTTPLYLPKAVTAERVRAGYPLGQSDGQYYTCLASSDTEKIGYYYVDHPAGEYCEKIP